MTATRTDTLLSINNVSMLYGDNVVLREVNAHIDDLIRPGVITGQITGLLGPSGVGKSTLLRIIAGLIKPTTGSVTLGSKLARAGDVGMVSQNYLIYRNRTVLSNLKVAAEQTKDKPTEKVAAQRAVDILNDFGLLDKSHLYPCQLSGGQRQRVAIAQQILAAGDFIVFDEPTAGLDPIAKAKTCDLISRVANRSETGTVIICSHDIPSVVAICDEIWLLGRTPGLPGANIVGTFDLMERGLAWEPNIRKHPLFASTVDELQDRFLTL